LDAFSARAERELDAQLPAQLVQLDPIRDRLSARQAAEVAEALLMGLAVVEPDLEARDQALGSLAPLDQPALHEATRDPAQELELRLEGQEVGLAQVEGHEDR